MGTDKVKPGGGRSTGRKAQILTKPRSLNSDKQAVFQCSAKASAVAFDYVDCPVGCGKRVSKNMINLHVDMCLLALDTITATKKQETVRSDHGDNKKVYSDYFECPLGCGRRISETMMNVHLDMCAVDSALHCKEHIDDRPRLSFPNIAPGMSKEHREVKLPAEVNFDASTRLQRLQSFQHAKNIQCPKAVPGLFLISDFITAEEEAALIASIDGDTETPWKHSSFNGHCNSKCFGVRTHFGLPGEPRLVRLNNPSLGEHDIPPYLALFPPRLHNMVRHLDGVPIELKNFTPNECNCNSYEAAHGHSLRPHFDDRSLSGPLLMNLSLGCDAKMTYIGPKSVETAVYLPRRTLQIVIGPARWVYQHSIKAADILGVRRVSVTWRHAGSKHSGIRSMHELLNPALPAIL